MKTFSEVGHGKNVANLEDLISRCVGFGATYNPFLAAIKIANMNTLKTNAQTAVANVVTMEASFALAEDNREAVFKPLKEFSTRIINALKGCGASDAIVKDAMTIIRKIQGKRAKPVKEAMALRSVDPNSLPVINPKTISVSQSGYDSMIEHYSKLIELLSSVPTFYNPNEPELKVSGLNALLASMKATNTAHINATTNAINARINRDEVLYKKVTGLLTVAQECKNYVKSVFGSKSPKYKEVSAIQFKRVSS